MLRFEHHEVILPSCDCDLTIRFPGGGEITIQARPSNADVLYNGSLDIILQRNQAVCNWEGDDMAPAVQSHPNLPHSRIAKQLVTELPSEYSAELIAFAVRKLV